MLCSNTESDAVKIEVLKFGFFGLASYYQVIRKLSMIIIFASILVGLAIASEQLNTLGAKYWR